MPLKNQIYKEKLAAQTEKVRCEEEEIENVDRFTYLGVTSRSDGDPLTTVKQRSRAAAKRFKALGTMWENEALSLPQALKIRIYEAGVISILRYGSESWTLTEQVINHIKSFNACRLHTITGNSIHYEVVYPTVDVWAKIRTTRLRYLGHILRDDTNKIVLHNIVRHLHANKYEGCILQDAPQTDSFEELEELAADRKKWNKFIREAFNTKHTHKPKIIQSTTKTSEAVNKPLPKALKGRKRVALKVVTNTITIRNPKVPPSPTNGGSLMEAPATVRRSRRLRLLQSGVT